MAEMDDSEKQQFEDLHARGIAAKDAGEHEKAQSLFYGADIIARHAGDTRKRLDTLNPMARASWSLGRYDEASKLLEAARSIAVELDLIDEEAIAISNLGRVAAIKTVKILPVGAQAEALRDSSVPLFHQAFEMLLEHPHLYYRYANASHGSVVSALAGERKFAWQLTGEGLAVAHQISPEPYDRKTPAEISPGGLRQLKAARYLIALGNHTPLLAAKARSELIR
jgi:tetratricopeptide (TPR) repeat protein